MRVSPQVDVLTLRIEQQRSLHWMLAQEADDAPPFMEVEVAEGVLPALRWRLEGRAIVPRAVKGGVRPTRPETAPPGWADLVELCWDDDPARRPEIARVHDILHAIPVDRLPSDDT